MKTFIVILLLFLFPPLGIILMWTWLGWKKLIKVLITGLFLLEFILSVFVFIYIFIAQPFTLGGRAMMPSYQPQQYFLVDKISYRLQPPRRGDVIVFEYANRENSSVARIIGLPGEEIMLKNGKVYINNEILNEPYLSQLVVTYGGEFIKDNTPIIIPENEYVAMGDNRTFSSDSRTQGFVDKDKIIGRMWLSY